MDLRLDSHPIQSLDDQAVALDDCQLAAFEEADFPGVFNDGRQVAGDEHLAAAFTNGYPAGITQTDRQQPVWFPGGHDHNAVRASDAFHRQFHSFGKVAGERVIAFNQIDDRFGIGIRVKNRALSQQLIAQAEIILHNTVMDDDNLAIRAQVGMSILLVRRAVCCPARMPDADAAPQRLLCN